MIGNGTGVQFKSRGGSTATSKVINSETGPCNLKLNLLVEFATQRVVYLCLIIPQGSSQR
jgi:hypothetical protein